MDVARVNINNKMLSTITTTVATIRTIPATFVAREGTFSSVLHSTPFTKQLLGVHQTIPGVNFLNQNSSFL